MIFNSTEESLKETKNLKFFSRVFVAVVRVKISECFAPAAASRRNQSEFETFIRLEGTNQLVFSKLR